VLSWQAGGFSRFRLAVGLAAERVLLAPAKPLLLLLLLGAVAIAASLTIVG